MRGCIIFNPAARGEKARRFKEQLAAFSQQFALKPTLGPGGGRALAKEAVREGFDTVVAAGGDGTLNEVLNGIGDETDGFARTRLGILPLGTVNVFAKEIGIPPDIIQAWRLILTGAERQVDLAQADFTEAGAPATRHFVQLAGAGLDARAIELVNWEQKKRYGPLAYVIAGVKAMQGRLPQIIATNGSETYAGELILIGNGRYYGGRFLLFPEASLTDGVLDVTVFARANWGAVARCGWNVLCGQAPGAGQAIRLRGASIKLTCPVPMPFQVEGENAGCLPAVFTLRAGGLRVIAP